jgi:Base plate wedge protein 53
MSQYFSAFPTINYSGVNLKNITLRANFISSFRQNSSNFYSYTVRDGETADALAYDYYGDPNYVWVIYMTNDMIDPYYDWPLSSNQLDAFIANKYGSIDLAKSQIVYYKQIPQDYYVNNITNDYILASLYNPSVNGYGWTKVTIDNDITIANYNGTLDPAIWSPIDAYTYEIDQNEKKRNIQLLDKRFISTIDMRLRDLMNG